MRDVTHVGLTRLIDPADTEWARGGEGLQSNATTRHGGRKWPFAPPANLSFGRNRKKTSFMRLDTSDGQQFRR